MPTDDPNKSLGKVQAAWKTCRMSDIASFRPGTWNGKFHDSNFIKAVAANFKKYSTGSNPYYRPYVSINHKDELRGGYVSDARVGADSLLVLDAEELPEFVGGWRNSGGLTQPSIEYFEPVYDPAGNLIDGFRKPDGTIEPGPVLKCLTLLGADSPAVKGLPDLPYAKFNDQVTRPVFAKGARVLKFSNNQTEGTAMDRAGAIAALQAMGYDISTLTDAVPDEFLIALVTQMQQMQAAPPAPPAPDASMQMADALATPTPAPLPAPVPATAPAPAAIPGVGPIGQPSQMVLKFSDVPAVITPQSLKDWATANTAAMNRMIQAAQATTAHFTQQANAAKFAQVKAFITELATPDAQGRVRIQPAQRAGMERRLLQCDGVTVRKFADGKTHGTALAEEMADLRATLPFFKLGDKMADAHKGTAGQKGQMNPNTRVEMLRATPQGRAILAKEGKK